MVGAATLRARPRRPAAPDRRPLAPRRRHLRRRAPSPPTSTASASPQAPATFTTDDERRAARRADARPARPSSTTSSRSTTTRSTPPRSPRTSTPPATRRPLRARDLHARPPSTNAVTLELDRARRLAPQGQRPIDHYVVEAWQGTTLRGAQAVDGDRRTATLTGLPAGTYTLKRARASTPSAPARTPSARATVSGSATTYAGAVTELTRPRSTGAWASAAARSPPTLRPRPSRPRCAEPGQPAHGGRRAHRRRRQRDLGDGTAGTAAPTT